MTLKWLGNGQYYRSTTYESNVVYALRFMIDCSVVGGNWVELQPGEYSVVQSQVCWLWQLCCGNTLSCMSTAHLQI